MKYICLNISDHACWNHCKKFLIDLKISFSAFICLIVITVTIFLLFNILQRVTTFCNNVWSEYVRIILVRKIMGNSINHEQDHDSGIWGGGFDFSELYNFGT